ncbi:MAG: cell division protein ZapA [Bacteroidota bacterium]|jgi:cell division protein ZapA|nr:cell division protein ZapA [Bacteroidota bacterium]
MAEVSLKIQIAGRTYPLTVKEEDEQAVQNAARMINDKVKEFEVNYSVRDKQDLLAMSALNLLATQQNAPKKTPDQDELNQLDLFVSDYLQKEDDSI